jgi:hypothetical protein
MTKSQNNMIHNNDNSNNNNNNKYILYLYIKLFKRVSLLKLY